MATAYDGREDEKRGHGDELLLRASLRLAAALDELMSDQELFTRSLLASGESAFPQPTDDWTDAFDDSNDPD